MRFCVLLFLACPCFAQSFHLFGGEEVFVDTPAERCVYVGNDNGHGTGVILKPGVVVTNFHGLVDDSDITIAGGVVQILRVVPKEDLAYLAWPVKGSPVQFADPKVGEEVYYIGNPTDHKCIRVSLRVVEIRGNKFFVDGMVLPGSSGSGVWNLKGELVGIIEGREQIGPYQGFGLGILAKVVKDKMP